MQLLVQEKVSLNGKVEVKDLNEKLVFKGKNASRKKTFLYDAEGNKIITIKLGGFFTPVYTIKKGKQKIAKMKQKLSLVSPKFNIKELGWEVKGNMTFRYKIKGLPKGTSFKAYAKAWAMKNGKKKYVRTGLRVHAFSAGGNRRSTNAKSVTVKKTKITLKTGKTYKIKARVNRLNKRKLLISQAHAPILRYLSSDPNVATVSEKGRIRAKSKGTCKIYVLAHNGVGKTIKVKVK
jgi:uncharacterized protein YjdB